MLPLFKRERAPKPNHFIALDIGSDVIKALVCESQGSIGVIRGCAKIRQKTGNMLSGAVLDMGSVIEHAAKAIEEACSQAQAYPNDLIIGIAGEFIKGVTYKTTYTRKEPHSKIDLNEMKNIIHKVQWKSFEQTRSQLAREMGVSEIDVKLVNASIVDAKVDGFRVQNPIGFQGTEVSIAIFNTFAPLTHFGALQTLAAELDLQLIAITAEPYAIAHSLEKGPEHVLNAIIIDIGATTTDIAVVRNGVIEGTNMFTIGGRTFSKRLASALNISLDEAEEIKQAYAKGKLEKHSEKIVTDAMMADAEVWLSGVTLTLSESAGNLPLPSLIYVCGGGSHLPEIKSALQSKEWSDSLSFESPPMISLITPKHCTHIKDTTQKLKDSEDVTPVALASLGSEFIGEEHLMTGILKKVIRLMQM